MKQIDAQEACQYAMEAHRKGDYNSAVQIYHQLLNHEPSNASVLYLLGDIATRQGLNGLAINLLSNSVTVKPTAPAYTALGCALKAEHFNEDAEAAWKKSIEVEPTAEAYSNLSSLFSDAGAPEKAISYTDQAMAIEPENPHAHWNRSLALLTSRRWKEGWIEHESRFNPVVQKTSKRRTIAPPWDGSLVRKLAVHGEQGIGDEIMFLSMLHEAVDRCEELVVEVEPRLMDIVERSFPGVRAYANEESLKAHEKDIDAQIALGSMGMLFRNADEDFPRAESYLYPDWARRNYWRQQFQIKGPGPYIGVAWAGGTKNTRAYQRTITPEQLQFVHKGTAISLQYGVQAEEAAKAAGFHYFPESAGTDMNEQFAMAAACDIIVTVAQTIVHVGGALGVPTYVLTPKGSSWRYGQGNDMLWYPSVKLLRQHREGDWGHPLKRAEAVVDELVKGMS